MVKPNDIISQCYVNLTDAIEKYQDNWICDETWFRVISARYPDVINSVGFSRAAFNRAISCRASQCGAQNASGIFLHHFSMPCPYHSGQRRKVSFYYRQVKGKPPASPSGPHDCEDVHVRARPIRLSTAERAVTQPLSVLPQSTDQQCPDNHRIDHGGNEYNANDDGHNGNNTGGSGGGGGKMRVVVIRPLLQ